MVRQTIDLFRKTQEMEHPEYELYNYSDAIPPKILPHKHNFYEIYFLLSERADYAVGRQVYHIKRGDILLLPPGLLHYPIDMHMDQGGRYSRIILWISIDYFESFAKIDPDLNHMWDAVIQNYSYLLHPTPGASQRILSLLLRVMDERNEHSHSTKAMSYSLILELMVLINRVIYEEKHFRSHTPASTLYQSIISYIHAHLADDLTLATLAAHFYVSKSYISRLFREYMGIPVHRYTLSLRLEGTRRAIQTGFSITSAMEMYGFQDYSSFYRAFKSAFLQSPKQYQDSISSQTLEPGEV